jgi:hypothetical protein
MRIPGSNFDAAHTPGLQKPIFWKSCAFDPENMAACRFFKAPANYATAKSKRKKSKS